MIRPGSDFSNSAILFLFLVLAILIQPLPATAGEKAKGITLMQLDAVTDLLMSPGCRYTYTLTRCPSAEAKQMRKLVRDKLAAGESKEQILDYFAKVYGPRVLAQPAKDGFYFVAWWFPYFLLADFLLAIGIILFFWRKKSEDRQTSSKQQAGRDLAKEEIGDLLEKQVQAFRNEKEM